MKLGVILIALVVSMPSLAGGYYNPSIDRYDPVSGIYYKSVESQTKSGFLSSSNNAITNLFIYDPSLNSGKYLFPEQDNFEIVALSFEISVEDGKVRFNSEYSASIKNNTGISERPPKSKILILTRNTETKQETFYFAQKNGTDLVKGRTISSSDSWHIDVKNSVVRVVRQVGTEIIMEQFPW